MAQTKISDTQLDQIEQELTKAKEEEIAAIESQLAALQSSLSNLEGAALAAAQASIAALQAKITQVNADFEACIQTLEKIREECAKAEGVSQTVLQSLFVDLKEQNIKLVTNVAGGATTLSASAQEATKDMYAKATVDMKMIEKSFPDLYQSYLHGGKSKEWIQIAFMQKTGVPAEYIKQTMDSFGMTSDSAYMNIDVYAAAQKAGMSYQDYLAELKKELSEYEGNSIGVSVNGITIPANKSGGRNNAAHTFEIPKQEDEFLRDLCEAADVPYELMAAIIAHESGSDPNAYNSSGASGYGQFIDTNTGWVSSTFGWYSGNGCEVAQNGKNNYNGTLGNYVSDNGYNPADWLEKAKELGADTSDIFNPYANMIACVSLLKDNYESWGSEGLQSVVGHYGEGVNAASTYEILYYYEYLCNAK